ncbi:hypothetical protein PHISCL_04049 [Aspergillus sclerotialis]|uniref:Uncharacterized protein n=1 Tax=Aspergillus sclerotialis TaxID=2070753 RepID=A0A3A2ZMV6_9EURO|nr:hypothetical protein PHISCL_04049 [Aspergillus sclerotialis]
MVSFMWKVLHQRERLRLQGFFATIKETYRVVFISRWDKKRSGFENLVEKCRQSRYEDVEGWNILSSKSDDLLVIIDEAERPYNSMQPWIGLIQNRMYNETGTRFCLFTSSGGPFLVVPHHVPLTRSSGDMPGISLFYTKTEFEDVVSRFFRGEPDEFTIAQSLRTHIFGWTMGHPGMVNAILTFIQPVFTFYL